MDLDFTETRLYLPCPHKGQCLAGSSLLVTLCSPSESEMSTQGQGKKSWPVSHRYQLLLGSECSKAKHLKATNPGLSSEAAKFKLEPRNLKKGPTSNLKSWAKRRLGKKQAHGLLLPCSPAPAKSVKSHPCSLVLPRRPRGNIVAGKEGDSQLTTF